MIVLTKNNYHRVAPPRGNSVMAPILSLNRMKLWETNHMVAPPKSIGQVMLGHGESLQNDVSHKLTQKNLTLSQNHP